MRVGPIVVFQSIILSIKTMISNEENFDSHFACFFIHRLFIDIYSEYYSVRVVVKNVWTSLCLLCILSKHMARVDCRGRVGYFAPMHASVIGDSTVRFYCLKGRLSQLTDASRQYHAILIV